MLWRDKAEADRISASCFLSFRGWECLRSRPAVLDSRSVPYSWSSRLSPWHIGFWLQARNLSKARSILAAHGLEWEWTDLKPGEARATVTRVIDSDSFQIVIVRINALEPGTVSIQGSDNPAVSSILEPVRKTQIWTNEVRLLIDEVTSQRGDTTRKLQLEVVGPGGGKGAIRSTGPGKNGKLAESLQVHIKSSIFNVGERVPLWDFEGEKYELIVK